jgi:hypothetical protein
MPSSRSTSRLIKLVNPSASSKSDISPFFPDAQGKTYQDVNKCSKRKSRPRLDVDPSLRRISYRPIMSLGRRSDLVGSGDCRRSIHQLYHFYLANDTYDCSSGYTLLREVVVCSLKCVHGAREEGFIAFSYVDWNQADTRTRDQVSVKPRVATLLAQTSIMNQRHTMVQRLGLLLPRPLGCEIADRGLHHQL